MFRVITPKFIKDFDAWLLLNYPVMWMSKIHYALWHGFTLWGFSALLGAIMPINLKETIQYELWYFLLTVLGIVILCFWVYHYVIFNKEKNYGTRSFSDEYKNFVLVFFSVAIFLMLPWPFEMIYNSRVAHMYGDEEVLDDINVLNERDPYLTNSTNNYYSWYDSVSKAQYFNIRQLNPYAASYYTPYYMQDSAKFPVLLTANQLYHKYRPVTDKDELEKKINEFIAIADKYNCPVNENASDLAQRYIDFLKRDRIPANELYGYGSYQYELNYTMNNLCNAKFQQLFIFKRDYLWVMFYFIISVTSFLLLFKITYWQQYLITLVVLLLYPLVMFIFSQLLPYDTYMRRDGFFEISILLLVVFSIITLFITMREEKSYKPFYNIFNQLFYVSMIYSPLLFLVFLHDNTNIFHNHDTIDYAGYMDKETTSSIRFSQTLSSEYYRYWSNEFDRWIIIMKYAGIIGFLLALPLMKNLFVKQISLPAKK